ncbi:MAG: hypothetical protein ACYDBS_06105, partial [Acidimicrobiales bacterium]
RPPAALAVVQRSTGALPLGDNRLSGRHYRCRVCEFTCHRDAVGAINILQKALHGQYVPIDPETHIRVTYLRAVEGWSTDHRKAHRKVQSRKAVALSSAQNRALTGVTQSSKPKPAISSTSPEQSEPGQLAVVA